jgi:microsomal dipeptidase-like Zn-dependent dipeptidase
MSEIEYLPYKTINVFIEEREYLNKVIETVLDGKNNLSKEEQIDFVKQFKQYVNVLGFRNVLKAPKKLQINAYVAAFENKNEVVPFTLSIWAAIKSDLAKEVQDWLQAEGWEFVAVHRSFDENEGFVNQWPDGLTFDKLVENFEKANPKTKADRNDLILMLLWISGQLPTEQSVI